jgi:hypothetical protein
MTVEGHLIKAIEAGRLDPGRLVDAATAEIVRQAIATTPPSDTPLRDIRANATRLAGRDISYLEINAARAAEAGPPAPPAPGPEVVELLQRKEKAEQLRRQRQEAGEPWPDAWEAEYQRIVDRLHTLTG